MRSSKYIEDTEDFYQNAPCGFLTCDANGRIAGINDTLLNLTGRTRESTVAVCSFYELLTAGSRLFAETHIMPLVKMQGFVNEVSFDMRAADGMTFPVLVNIRSVQSDQEGEEYYRLTVIDYTLRKRYERELIEAKRDAESNAEMLRIANTDLQHFAQIASHDLQAPLNTVTGLIQLLEIKGLLKRNAESEEILDLIFRNTRRMKSMISDLLEYQSFRESDSDFERVSLGEVCRAALEGLAGEVEATGASFDIGALPAVSGAKIRLVRLFQNLFSNALKYRSEAPPAVLVSSREEGDKIITAVADNGTGFDPSHAEKIFGFMERLQSRDQIEGTGIGLSACRRIAESHGGSIRAESVPGEGSVFFVTLPRA